MRWCHGDRDRALQEEIELVSQLGAAHTVDYRGDIASRSTRSTPME